MQITALKSGSLELSREGCGFLYSFLGIQGERFVHLGSAHTPPFTLSFTARNSSAIEAGAQTREVGFVPLCSLSVVAMSVVSVALCFFCSLADQVLLLEALTLTASGSFDGRHEHSTSL